MSWRTGSRSGARERGTSGARAARACPARWAGSLKRNWCLGQVVLGVRAGGMECARFCGKAVVAVYRIEAITGII